MSSSFPPPTESSRILVYTDGEVIGDGILRLPFAAALKQALPHTHLTWLSSGYSVYDTVLRDMAKPIIDDLLIMPNRRMEWKDFLRGPPVTRRRHFDLIIDTQRNVKRSFWLTRIKHKRFISAAGDYLFSTQHSARPRGGRFFDTLMHLGELGTGQPLAAPPLALPAGDWRKQAQSLLPEGRRYIGLVIGAGDADKCWPLERFIALAHAITAQGAIPVLFLGPKEQPHLATIRTALPHAILPLAHHTSPYFTMAVAGLLTAAVANDSGGGHLLDAGCAPLVTLFRSATVRIKFMPRGSHVIALAPEDFGGTIMADIPLDAVQTALNQLSEDIHMVEKQRTKI